MSFDIKRLFLRGIEATWCREIGHQESVDSATLALRDAFENANSSAIVKELVQGHAVIESKSGLPDRIVGRWLPRWPSLVDVYVDRVWKRLPDDCCRIYYNHPKSCPNYTILAYACSGRRTSLATLRAGLTILEEIAILIGNRAIVCQSTNPRIGNRVLKHFGYVQHVPHLKGRHYIKRFDRQF